MKLRFSGILILAMALSFFFAIATAQSPVPKSVVPLKKANLTSADVEAKLAELTALCQKNQRKEVAEQFGDEDIVGWLGAYEDKAEGTRKVVQGLNLRGTSFNAVGNSERALQDFEDAVKLSPSNGYMWNSLGSTYRRMNEDEKALEAFKKAVEFDFAAHKTKPLGWMPISATLNAASILTKQTRYDEALEVLKNYNQEEIMRMSPYWAGGMLRAYGQVYLATGREEEGLAKYKAALELEKKQGE